MTALQKQLSEVKNTLANENSEYVNGLVTKINSINTSLDGLKNNITGLDSKANEINTALGQANSTAGGPTSPRSVATAPGVGQQSNIPLLSSSPSTTVPGYNKTVKQLHDQLGGIFQPCRDKDEKHLHIVNIQLQKQILLKLHQYNKYNKH